MRLIGSINSEQLGDLFSGYLQKLGIHHQLEIMTDRDWGSANYGSVFCNIWIQDEDRVDEAQKALQSFKEHPNAPEFTSGISVMPENISETSKKSNQTLWARQAMGPITRFFLVICAGLLFLQQIIPSSDHIESNQVVTFFSSPIDKAMLYDFPQFYVLLDKFLHLYGFEALEKQQNLTPEAHNLLKGVEKTPYWQGFYSFVIEKGFTHLTHWNDYPPLFEKIRQGEVWRIFTPALLHADIFHLFFNMIWLIVLGKQLEHRMKPFPYIAFILLVGIFSNTAQYLMSGPNFLGFSGILCGMLTFVWVRQKTTPWEGYQLDRSTFIFMMIFIFGIAGLQLISFISEKTLQTAITPNIANTAHISGALFGAFLGKFNFFGWRNG